MKHSINPTAFLNHLTLHHLKNPFHLNPYALLNDLFNQASPAELQEMFEEFHAAAFSKKPRFKKQSPANLLFTFGMLEQLVELAYLLTQQKHRARRKKKMEMISTTELPVYADEECYEDPFKTLQAFFNHASLPGWKLNLHIWLGAALSRHSITEDVEPGTILPFINHIEKLIAALGAVAFQVPVKERA